MNKTPDTSILENIAEDKISFELQKYDLLVAKPKSDQKGTDLLLFKEIADNVKFCRIQSKGRSLEHSDQSFIEIPENYVTDGFLCFLYLYLSYNSDELYIFFPVDIKKWEKPKGKYVLRIYKSTVSEKLSTYVFKPNKVQVINTLINAAEIHNEFRSLIYGQMKVKLPNIQSRMKGTNTPPTEE